MFSITSNHLVFPIRDNIPSALLLPFPHPAPPPPCPGSDPVASPPHCLDKRHDQHTQHHCQHSSHGLRLPVKDGVNILVTDNLITREGGGCCCGGGGCGGGGDGGGGGGHGRGCCGVVYWPAADCTAPSSTSLPVYYGEQHVVDTKKDCKVEVVNPNRSRRNKDVNKEGDTVESMEENIEERGPSWCHEMVFDNIGVEGSPVDETDQQGRGGGQVLQGPGDPEGGRSIYND